MSTCNQLDLESQGLDQLCPKTSRALAQNLAPIEWFFSYGKPTLTIVCDQPCSRLKSSISFNRGLVPQNKPPSKKPFKTQPQFENEDVTRSA
jgi:hypothetical protein